MTSMMRYVNRPYSSVDFKTKVFNRVVILMLIFISVTGQCHAQKQLVLLKRQKVLVRLNPGDDFNYRLKGSEQTRYSYVNNLFDTAVVAHKDVVPLHKIDRLYFQRNTYANFLGGILVTGGIGYFLIDQINVVVVNGESPNLDKGVTQASAALVAAGLPLMLIKKKSQKIGGKYRLLVVTKGSPFYKPDLRMPDPVFNGQ